MACSGSTHGPAAATGALRSAMAAAVPASAPLRRRLPCCRSPHRPPSSPRAGWGSVHGAVHLGSGLAAPGVTVRPLRCSGRTSTTMRTLVHMNAHADADCLTMRERMLAGELYVFDDPELAEANAAALDLVAAYNATTARQDPLRRALLEQLLGAVGEETVIRPPLYVDYGSHISVGARCFANF